MGKGNRGFKPQGIMNPMLMSRGRAPPSGPTMMERLHRASRPTWEDLKKLAQKKEKGSAEFLEEWENEHYKQELTKFREAKRSHQEKSQLDALKDEAKSLKKALAEKDAGGGSLSVAAGGDKERGRRSDDDDTRRETMRRSKKDKRRKRRRRSWSSSSSSSSLSSSSDESSGDSSCDDRLRRRSSGRRDQGDCREELRRVKRTKGESKESRRPSKKRRKRSLSPVVDNPHRLSSFLKTTPSPQP